MKNQEQKMKKEKEETQPQKDLDSIEVIFEEIEKINKKLKDYPKIKFPARSSGNEVDKVGDDGFPPYFITTDGAEYKSKTPFYTHRDIAKDK